MKSYIEPGMSEVSSILCRTDWVRIFVSRNIDESDEIMIDVEVTAPFTVSSEESSPTSDSSTQIQTRSLLETFIQHIQYILALEEKGFTVDFIGNGCLLLATKLFIETPDTEIFRLLCPPDLSVEM